MSRAFQGWLLCAEKSLLIPPVKPETGTFTLGNADLNVDKRGLFV
jgi:hypothetical protein